MDKQQMAIVGGGMVGSILALLLARFVPQTHITLLDKQPTTTATQRPSFDGRSTAIAPTTVDCFKQLGLWPQLQGGVTPIAKIHISDRGHAGLGLFDGDDNHGEPLGYVVENARLGPVLMQALANEPTISTIAGEATQLHFNGQGAELCWQTIHQDQAVGDIARALFNVVLVCDGAASPLRQRLGIGAKTVDYQQHALVANVRHSLAHNSQAYERFTARGPLALLPRGGHAGARESTVVWTCPNAELADIQSMSAAERLSALQAQFGYRLGLFTEMSEPVFYPLELVIAQEQVRSRLVLMGNAAHFLHPVAGQGFNLAVRDCLRLVETFKSAAARNQDLGALALLQDYAKAQYADQRNTIGMSHGFNRVFTRAPLPMQLLRTAGFLALELNPFMREQFIGLLSGRAQGQVRL
ncbi:MAG: FAD-dependent monooxygenase [Marinagarivorans sp.]|nr:FAD-dependent monooxygenase [Marinagarivorans sp.]